MPYRTCVGCKARKPVGEMVRLCLDRQNQLFISVSSSGRGVWLCKCTECFDKASGKGKIERALKVNGVSGLEKQLSSIYDRLIHLG
jgi:predicted RNA-binding protein YlxR (DUF448 family)